jgi:Zn-dependent M28 family amino/carboxypeptidase
MRRWYPIVLSAAFLAACTGAPDEDRRTSPPSPSSTPSASSPFAVGNVVEVVRVLAGEIGPRETTSDAFRRAGIYVERRFESFGYQVRHPTFRVPAGLSNLVAVPEGETFNVVAEPRAFDATRPHLIVGAHLDTVPQAPGAVDNATGVGVVIELARLAALNPPPVPVVFVAFGGEEARVPHGGLHGSKAFVAALNAIQRGAITAAIVVDRMGTGDRIPVCTATDASNALARAVRGAARRVAATAFDCENESSDHVSFSRAGILAVRIGPDDFREYHTPRDVPSILVPAQAQRAGAILWEYLRSTV